MAVIPNVPGISVEVRVNDEKAQEYADPEGETHSESGVPMTSCYIESQSGAKFSIHLQVSDAFQTPGDQTHIAFPVFVDHSFIRGPVCSLPPGPGTSVRQQVRTALGCCQETGGLQEHELVFITVESVEAEAGEHVARDKKMAKELGVIKVEAFVGQMSASISASYKRREYKEKISLAEKAMKGRALSHGTSFAPGRPAQVSHVSFTERVPVGCFIFKYRSRDALRQELIIPNNEEELDSMGKPAGEASAPLPVKRERSEGPSPTLREAKRIKHTSFVDLTV